METESDAIALDAQGTGEGAATHAEHDEANTAADTPDAQEPDATGEGEAEAQAPEEIEFDFGGNKFKAPKGAIPDEIADALDKFTKGTWSDYTRKSQEVAEARKSLEAQQAAVQKLGTLRNDALTAYAQGLQVKAELEQLSRVDMQALWQSNPDQARRLSDLHAQKQAQFQSVVSRVNELENAAASEETAHHSRLIEEGRAKVAKSVKGFDEAKLTEYAIKSGYTAEQVKLWPTDPAGTVMAWKAMQYDAMQAKAAQAAKPAPAAATPLQPIKGRAAPAAPDPDRMTTEEWFKWRNAQVAKNGRR